MIRTLFAGLMAVSLTLTAAPQANAQQQQPSGQDIARIIAGAAGIYIIGKAISDRNKRERREREAARAATRFDYLTPAEREELRRLQDLRRLERERPRAGRHGRCWRESWKDGRWVTYRDKKCMKKWRKSQRHADRPRECLRKRWTSDGWVKYYSDRCLRKHGYGRRANRDD